MESGRAEGFAEGTLAREAMTPAERAIEDLARKSVRAPTLLAPSDLAPLSAAVGASGALEVVGMLGAFHFVNRVADLVGIESETPIVQRRFRWLRSFGIRLQSAVMRRALDLSNRPVEIDVDAVLIETEKLRGEPLPAGYRLLTLAPNVAAWAHRMALEWPSIDPSLAARVRKGVRSALPSGDEDVEGVHPRPSDPVDALVFVGTRYPARTTDALMQAARGTAGYDEAGLTDLVFAISACNAWERVDRLLA
jgi:hypothetical protein